jgi:hypothetical protein
LVLRLDCSIVQAEEVGDLLQPSWRKWQRPETLVSVVDGAWRRLNVAVLTDGGQMRSSAPVSRSSGGREGLR